MPPLQLPAQGHHTQPASPPSERAQLNQMVSSQLKNAAKSWSSFGTNCQNVALSVNKFSPWVSTSSTHLAFLNMQMMVPPGPHEKFINLAFWNANSIQAKIHEIYDFTLTNFIDCMSVCETFWKSNTILHSHPEFVTYRSDRPDGVEKGGVREVPQTTKFVPTMTMICLCSLASVKFSLIWGTGTQSTNYGTAQEPTPPEKFCSKN